MAEPQTRAQSEQGRPGGDGATAGASTERRSFQEERAGAAQGETRADAARDLARGGAQAVGETTRNAGRQAMTAWRQAFDPLLAMQYDVSQWMDDMFRHTFGFRGAPATQAFRPMGLGAAAGLFGLPPADLKETDTAHVLSIELPGLAREDVDLSVEGDTLVVCGHKAEESEDASASYRVSERRFGRFERAFPLPPDVDRGRIEARFKDGVLKVTLPKNPATAPPRSRIEIRS